MTLEVNPLPVDRLLCMNDYCQQQIKKKQFAGISWQISIRGNLSGPQLHGYADHDMQHLLRDDSIFRIYSMTKPVISVLCLMMIERGQLRLSDTIDQWVPEFKKQRVLESDGKQSTLHRAITIEDLLTHRAGFSYDFLPDCDVADEYRRVRLAEDGTRKLSDLVHLLASLPLANQPGHRWFYSYATDVLAHILQCVADQPLAQLLQDALFTPLNMKDTAYHVANINRQRLCEMFGQRQLGEVPDEAVKSNSLRALPVESSYPSDPDSGFVRGGIGLFSTLDDYFQFMQVMQTGKSMIGEKIISSAMLDMMWQNRLAGCQMPISIGKSVYSGYGWGLAGRVMTDSRRAMQLTRNGEGGWAGAASTYFWIDREREFSGLVMAQYLGSAVQLGPDIQTLGYAAIG